MPNNPNNYDVLPISTHLGNIIDRKNNTLKPFVAVYFPDEILTKMDWKDANLILSVEKDCLKITKSDDPLANYYLLPGELTYLPVEDE